MQCTYRELCELTIISNFKSALYEAKKLSSYGSFIRMPKSITYMSKHA